MKLVDTNVAVHLLLSGPLVANARALYERDPEWHTEPLLFVELTNVLATATRATNTTRAKAMLALDEAHQLFDGALHAIDDQTAFATAIRFRVSCYGARFIAAATALGCRLVTEDAKLRAKAPALTWSIAEALAARGER